MDVQSIALSGMQASLTGFSVSANNTANVNTAGFKSKSVTFSEVARGGTKAAAIVTDESPGPQLIRTDGPFITPAQAQPPVEMSNVSLPQEAVSQMLYQRSFEANASVIKAQDEMVGTAIDILAR